MFQPLIGPPRLVALGGASAHEISHSMEAFRLGLRLGADGVQSDARLTADGVVTLCAEPTVGGRFRRRQISELNSAELPEGVSTLADLVQDIGPDSELVLSVANASTVTAVLGTLGDSGFDLGRLWLVSGDLELLEAHRKSSDGVRIVHSVRLAALNRGLEAHAATLRRLGIDGIWVPFDELTAGHVALLHRFTRLVLAHGPQHVRQMEEVLGMGIDALGSGQVERMVDVATDLGIRAR